MQSIMIPPLNTNMHGSLHDQITAQLRDLIVRGELPCGAKLSERHLGERFGFPRTPLREALKVLAVEGLVNRTPNRGAHVADMGVQDVQQIFEVLQALEAQAAKLLVIRITDAEINIIQNKHNQMVAYRNANLLMEYFNANQDLHQLIIDASGNTFLARAYQSHSARIRRFRYLGNEQSNRWMKASAEHEHILEAIQDRDGPLLEALLCGHLRKGWIVVQHMLTSQS